MTLAAHAGIAGCSLLTDVDGLAGGPASDGGSADGRESPRPDDGKVDGGSVPDGNADAVVAPARDASGCALYPGASLCVDFEGSSKLGTPPWTNSDVGSPTGTLSTTEAFAVSGTHAASFDIPDAGMGCKYLQLQKAMPGKFASFSVRLDVRLETDGYFLAVDVNPPDKVHYALILSLFNGIGSLKIQHRNADGGLNDVANERLAFELPISNRFVPVTLEIVNGYVTFTMASASKRVALPTDYALDDLHTSFGPYCAVAPARMLVDDIAITATP